MNIILQFISLQFSPVMFLVATHKVIRVFFSFARFAGQVGYFYANIKTVAEAPVGDTIYLENQKVEPLPGFRKAIPMVSVHAL